MGKQYIRKRRFTKETLFLSLISVYVWFIYEMISIIENDRGGRHLFYFLSFDMKCNKLRIITIKSFSVQKNKYLKYNMFFLIFQN